MISDLKLIWHLKQIINHKLPNFHKDLMSKKMLKIKFNKITKVYIIAHNS